jgi:hypothetical protein
VLEFNFDLKNNKLTHKYYVDNIRIEKEDMKSSFSAVASVDLQNANDPLGDIKNPFVDNKNAEKGADHEHIDQDSFFTKVSKYIRIFLSKFHK